MDNEIKREMEKIEIPKELDSRVELGIKRVKQEGKKKNRTPKWIIGAAASVIIIVGTYSIGGSYIADAADTLLGKLFGSEEKIQKAFEGIPEKEAKAYLPQMEQHLELAKAHLSPEEFAEYSKLIKELMQLDMKRAKNPHADYENEMDKLSKKIEQYGIYALTDHTVEEAQALASYPINRPTFIPDGYKLVEERAHTEEAHVGEDPEVILQYQQKQGEFNFYTITQKIDESKEDELELRGYDHIDSYQLNGYAFEHGYGYNDGHGNVQTMRVTIPKEGYEIIIDAAILSKEEMEKVLLSMVE
ncbi:DUF4367 domain-containing protein [Bacillus sp. SD088]|uniref:DUF4367 domain-containing protein n=1 Tax=Bacillus sp. SD088 TaxID=2782012 RepID=UPI001A95F0FE|nr:DUF4367 domain-containing protein [Bacillus sp. SD088]MBO0993698.1 hypothetical protein [Bacillus sp. SD088]